MTASGVGVSGCGCETVGRGATLEKRDKWGHKIIHNGSDKCRVGKKTEKGVNSCVQDQMELNGAKRAKLVQVFSRCGQLNAAASLIFPAHPVGINQSSVDHILFAITKITKHLRIQVNNIVCYHKSYILLIKLVTHCNKITTHHCTYNYREVIIIIMNVCVCVFVTYKKITYLLTYIIYTI